MIGAMPTGDREDDEPQPRLAPGVRRRILGTSLVRSIRGLRSAPEPASLRQRALAAERSGELTAARDLWAQRAASAKGPAADTARVQLRRVEGRLTETDTSWLPLVDGPAEHLEPSSRERVLHIAKSSVPERWSGYTIRTMSNLRAQVAVGLDPVVVTDIGWPRVVGVEDVEPLVVVEGIAHYRLDRGPGYDLAQVPNDVEMRDAVEAMIPLVRELRPSILHAHSGHRGGELALMALALRERFGIPVVYEVRGLFEAVWSPDEAMAERSELFARRLAQETRILHAVDGVLVISDALRDDLIARGIPGEKMSLLPNGIDPETFGVALRDEALRERLGLAGRFVVGYVGNLDHVREGIEVLVAAVAELRRRGRDEVAALIVGDGPRREGMAAEAERLGVADRCVFTGRVPYAEVAGYYAQIDLFTNPRIDERAAHYITPLKPYEAMALGIPILVSDLPALTEIVDPPNRGQAAPAGDPVGLADAIERLMDDPDGRARMAAAGREWVRTERRWAANGPRYLAAYERILGPIA